VISLEGSVGLESENKEAVGLFLVLFFKKKWGGVSSMEERKSL